MFKKILVVLFSVISTNGIAQKVIQMENMNGVFRISCSVNGAKMKMVFDTGASNVSLSESMANFLYDNDYISKKDILGTSKTQTADGSIHNNVVINIKDIEISGLHLRNVRAVVISGQNAPLLLGQTAIQKLGSITIEGNRLIVNDAVGNLSDAQIDKLEKELIYYLKNDNYRAALDVLEKVEMGRGLNSYGFRKKAYCLSQLNNYQECINTCLRWNRYSGNDKTLDDKAACYTWLCENYMGLEQYSESVKWGEKAVLTSKNNLNRVPWDYLNLCWGYMYLDNYSSAINYGKQAVASQLKKLKTSSNNVLKGLVHDDDLNYMYYTLAACYILSKDHFSGAEYMIHSAMMGRKDAIKYCIDNNIDYQEKAKQMLRRQ
jgi:clan AA aspartic protease (TIGR02281 family)